MKSTVSVANSVQYATDGTSSEETPNDAVRIGQSTKRCQEMLEKERKERRNGTYWKPTPGFDMLSDDSPGSSGAPPVIHYCPICHTTYIGAFCSNCGHPSDTNPTPDARLAHALSFSFHLQPSNTQFPPRRSSLHDQDVPLS